VGRRDLNQSPDLVYQLHIIERFAQEIVRSRFPDGRACNMAGRVEDDANIIEVPGSFQRITQVSAVGIPQIYIHQYNVGFVPVNGGQQVGSVVDAVYAKIVRFEDQAHHIEDVGIIVNYQDRIHSYLLTIILPVNFMFRTLFLADFIQHMKLKRHENR